MKINITQNIKAIILGLIISAGMGYAGAQNFAGPTCSPTANPGCNVPAPINVGGGTAGNIYSQIKTGALTLNHLFTPDLTVTKSSGTVTGITNGSTLSAIGSNTGKVGWVFGAVAIKPRGSVDWVQGFASGGTLVSFSCSNATGIARCNNNVVAGGFIYNNRMSCDESGYVLVDTIRSSYSLPSGASEVKHRSYCLTINYGDWAIPDDGVLVIP